MAGFTLVEIMIVVALIGLLATIASPTWVRARTNSQKTTCVNNLRQIEAAKQQWALENQKSGNALVTPENLLPYFQNKTMPTCPAGGVYTLNTVGLHPLCNIPGHVLPKQ